MKSFVKSIFRLVKSRVNHPDARGDSVSEIKLRSTYNYLRASCWLERKESRDHLLKNEVYLEADKNQERKRIIYPRFLSLTSKLRLYQIF